MGTDVQKDVLEDRYDRPGREQTVSVRGGDVAPAE
jgi:hypothetical protein